MKNIINILSRSYIHKENIDYLKRKWELLEMERKLKLEVMKVRLDEAK